MLKRLLIFSIFFTVSNLFAQTVCKRLVTTFDYSTSTGYTIQGTAELKDSLGVLYLTFSSDFYTQPGPDLYVYLTETGAAPTAVGNDDYEIAILTSNSGAQTYTLPSTVSIDDYDYVTIHCKQFNHLWNSGLLGVETCFTYPSYSNITEEHCNSYVSPSGNSVWMNTGVYEDTLIAMSSDGGDSIITIDLTINTVNSDVEQLSNSADYVAQASNATFQWINCSTNTIVAGETNMSFTPSESGDYAVIVTSNNSCVDTSSCFTFSKIESCISYMSPSGNHEWNTSGIYMDTLTGTSTIDSVITIDLTIKTVNADVELESATNELVAQASNSTFQWINCNDGSWVNGETNMLFTPSQIGEYAVIVTSDDNCVDTSACTTIQTVGINEGHVEYAIYPNPTKGSLTLDVNDLDLTSIKAYNLLQQRVLPIIESISHNQVKLQLNAPRGVYLIYFQNKKGIANYSKVVLE